MSAAAEAVTELHGDIAPGPHVITIGNFDGVHLGHRHLIGQLRELAVRHNARPLVVTFEPHPTSVLRPDPPLQRIVTPERKLELLRSAGIDDILVIEFDREFANLSPEAFLDYLVPRTTPAAILVGDNFRFGRARSGDGDLLRSYGSQHGFVTELIEQCLIDGAPASSSRIRRHVQAGELPEAEALLGRRFRLSGVVRDGMARGRDMGFPTANLTPPSGLCIPADGIYAAYARTAEQPNLPRETLVYIGASPTFDPRERLVEAHILDFSGDLYATELELEFIAFLRGDQAFDSVDALVAQMQRDEAAARQLFKDTHPEAEAEAAR